MSIVGLISKRLPVVAALLVGAAGAASFAAACSDSGTSSTPTADAGKTDGATVDSAVATGGSVDLVITYTGTAKGPAICTAWPTGNFPADTDFPIGTGSNEKPTWPGTNTVTITDLRPGPVWGLCYIMVGLDHRMGPAGIDPLQMDMIQAVPDIVAGKTSKATITLVDPPPDSDGGTEGGVGDASDGG